MINTGKVLLTIHLEGGTLVRKSKPEFIPYEFQKQSYNSTTGEWGQPGKTIKGAKRHYGFYQKPCTLKIKLTEYAYNYMISKEIPEFWDIRKSKAWENLKPLDRLKIHLNKLCRHHGGKFFTFEILED